MAVETVEVLVKLGRVFGVFFQMMVASISSFCGQAVDLLSSVMNEPISYPEYFDPLGRVIVHLMIISQFLLSHLSRALFSYVV